MWYNAAMPTLPRPTVPVIALLSTSAIVVCDKPLPPLAPQDTGIHDTGFEPPLDPPDSDDPCDSGDTDDSGDTGDSGDCG